MPRQRSMHAKLQCNLGYHSMPAPHAGVRAGQSEGYEDYGGRRVKKINRQNHPMQKTWHRHGYDTAWVPPHCGMVPSRLEEDCIRDPKRVTPLRILY